MKLQFKMDPDKVSQASNISFLFQYLMLLIGKVRLAVILKNCNSNTRKAHILAGIEEKLIVINKARRILIC